jgi:hypothetical protein
MISLFIKLLNDEPWFKFCSLFKLALVIKIDFQCTTHEMTSTLTWHVSFLFSQMYVLASTSKSSHKQIQRTNEAFPSQENIRRLNQCYNTRCRITWTPNYSSEKKAFLAYFPKMKVGLSNHQSVCLYLCLYVCLSVYMTVCLSVCPQIITFEQLGRFEWYFFTEMMPFTGTSMQ